ncbi:MAG: Gfo/Idh/MocA family oxidoreductase [Alphaproteobacteria bacterium]|nr:Gfo/Idh/MocA family oxidoreductase [Alphaproteobacteria bacterium]MBU1515401.1 Gfo/Idh/MocA family oxidoreductase [Alphaproteobacteria bacterium]MBU2092964.1 Gfo/Idh/MocA family oxidoreductase [Alphaproteobacteria bacterium]MBU2153596.1 Gfo/Idh/MocA family oxidoreductase [Alphaproteobacteria bacterium]MBU2309909.1 Gfo/Idh/MocA family oxidoreductase [Alphaproteobacteria bacterium]
MANVAPVRIGILGCAHIVKAVLIDPATVVPEIALVAVASRDADRAAAYAADHGMARSYGDYQALLDDPEVEVVYNPLPNSLHAEWTVRALQAGKAVFCEKPLANNAAEARRMVEAADAAGLPLIEAFHYRHHPVARFIDQTIRSGALGPLRRLEARLNIKSARLTDDNIRFQPELGGGSTMDLGAYCINMLRRCVGEEPTVVAATPTLHSPQIDVSMRATLAFPGGATATFECSHRAEAFETWLVVEGERGTLRCDNPFLPPPGTTVTVETGGQTRTTRFDDPATYVFQARALADVIRNGAPILTPGSDGIANMTVIDAVYRKAGLAMRGDIGARA